MQTGSLGDIVFEVGGSTVFTPGGISITYGARYEEHQVQGAEPRPEYMSPELGTCSLQIILRRDLGVDPIGQAEALKGYMDDGEVLDLVLADKYLGKWTIRKLDQQWRHMLKGAPGPLAITLTVELKEYF